ncbi:hypothetical protein [Maribacter flavus]|uniref:Uncharacterized protein n=1 Tax=Maribacter flavus TaxID=1658664 RepID=A0A5B2TUN5_9FLAO|nr:hypothetical protein [Maribacter flavus]KAA2218246.1 hypothetical protein F0361_01100 [Maribacter flavus]
MKAIIDFFRRWIQQWKDYFRMRKIDKLTATLQDNLIERTKARVALKKEIYQFITDEFKVNPRSKFIKPSLRREIVDAVYAKYRQRMEECKVVVNYSLQFAK